MPTRDTPWPDGTPCWVDYGAVDPPAARTFYGDLFGWTFTEESAEFGGYTNALLDGHQAAGMGPQMNPDDPAGWTTYLATGDVRACLAAVAEHGGTVVVEPMEVGPMGTMAIALDPTGTAFGLWQSGTHTGVQVHGQPGALTWNEASVSDPDAARSFYAAVFGYAYDPMPGVESYTTVRLPGREDPVAGLGGTYPGMPGGWQVCFAVESTDDTVAAVEARGGRVVVAPMDSPYGRFAVVADPWGGAFEIMGGTPQAVPGGG